MAIKWQNNRSRLIRVKACLPRCVNRWGRRELYEFASMKQEQRILSSSAIGRTLGVLRCRPFFLFWIGAFISNTGNWTENAAQSWAVTSQTGGHPHQGMLVEIL